MSMNGVFLTTVVEFKINIKQEENSPLQQAGLTFNEESCEMLLWEHRFNWGRYLDTSKIRSEIPGKF